MIGFESERDGILPDVARGLAMSATAPGYTAVVVDALGAGRERNSWLASNPMRIDGRSRPLKTQALSSAAAGAVLRCSKPV